MGCSRRGCREAMCQTYIDGVGYICGSCKDEFKKYLEKDGHDPKTEGQIKTFLTVFMDRQKGDDTEIIDVDDFFYKNTR